MFSALGTPWSREKGTGFEIHLSYGPIPVPPVTV